MENGLRFSILAICIMELVVLFHLFRLKNKSFKYPLLYLFLYFIVAFILDSLGLYQLINNSISHTINNIYVPLEFVLLSLFMTSFLRNKAFKISIHFIVIFYLLFQIYFFIYIPKFDTFNWFGTNFTSITLALLGLLIISSYFKSKRLTGLITDNPSFWFVLTIFLINTIDIFYSIILTQNYNSEDNTTYYFATVARNILKSSLMIGYLLGLRKNRIAFNVKSLKSKTA